jgi:heme/copper-type cytochrome/quinol oxidase subunit 2
MRGDWLLAGMISIIALPMLWIAGLNTSEFLTKPFAEKKITGLMSWVIAIIVSGITYLVFGALLVVLFKFLQVI